MGFSSRQVVCDSGLHWWNNVPLCVSDWGVSFWELYKYWGEYFYRGVVVVVGGVGSVLYQFVGMSLVWEVYFPVSYRLVFVKSGRAWRCFSRDCLYYAVCERRCEPTLFPQCQTRHWQNLPSLRPNKEWARQWGGKKRHQLVWRGWATLIERWRGRMGEGGEKKQK